jgi:hypothetical protein
LEADEAVVVDSSSVVLAQLGEESRKASNLYKDVLDGLSWLSDGGPRGASVVTWGDLGTALPGRLVVLEKKVDALGR